jgi:transcriptional regulator with XRE-family HTH domain
MSHPAKRAVQGATSDKAAYEPMSDQRKLEVVAELTDDVLAALTRAFFQVIKREKWGKRDLARISGINETAIGHILAGRRKNLTIESIALLARAMQMRPELVLHDLRASRPDRGSHREARSACAGSATSSSPKKRSSRR